MKRTGNDNWQNPKMTQWQRERMGSVSRSEPDALRFVVSMVLKLVIIAAFLIVPLIIVTLASN